MLVSILKALLNSNRRRTFLQELDRLIKDINNGNSPSPAPQPQNDADPEDHFRHGIQEWLKRRPPSHIRRLRWLIEKSEFRDWLGNFTLDLQENLDRQFETLKIKEGPLPEKTLTNPYNINSSGKIQRLQAHLDIELPLILISQVQRSGGSLLSQLFDSHPQVHAHPGELRIGHPDKSVWPSIDIREDPNLLFDKLNEEKAILLYLEEGYYKDGKSTRDSRFGERYPFLFGFDIQRALFVEKLTQSPPKSDRDVLNAYITSYFSAWLDYQQAYSQGREKKFWSAFTARLSNNFENIEKFFNCYPDGYFISIIREPASWYASASQHDDREYSDLDMSLSYWRSSVNSMCLAKEKYPERTIILSFEKLVKNTPDTVAQLCKQLGLEESEKMLNPTFNGISIQANSSFAEESNGVIDSSDRGDRLTPEIAGQIRERCQEDFQKGISLCL